MRFDKLNLENLVSWFSFETWIYMLQIKQQANAMNSDIRKNLKNLKSTDSNFHYEVGHGEND